MKGIQRFSLRFILFPVFAAGVAYTQEETKFRTFTRQSDGRQLQAYVVSCDGDQVTLRVKGRKEYVMSSSVFVSKDQDYLKNWSLASKGMPALDQLDSRIQPGAAIRVELPGLVNTKQGETAGFSLRIPERYRYPEPVPVLVYIHGGKGSDKLKSVPPIVDKEAYVLAAFPYPESLTHNEPVATAPKDQLREIEAYHSAFLNELKRLVPNLSTQYRLVAGSSNGAHTIGASLVMDWKAYTEFFNGFIIWEGGGCVAGNNYRAARGKDKVLWLGWGEKSKFKDYAKARGREIEDARAQVTLEGIPGAGHNPTKKTWAAVRRWLESTAEDALNPEGDS